MNEPTDTGKERFPNGFYDGWRGSVPCTCKPDCEIDCKGRGCGCEACRDEYSDAMSGRDD